ncbi:MAG: hypothetical protein ACRDH2_08510, partial [Anaerolineales bacterium]
TGWSFSGFLLAVEDGNSYLAKMGEGAHGAWRFTLAYSSEPQRGAFVFLFYLLLGKLAGTSHEAQGMVYHLARLACGFALLLVSYRFLAEFLPRVRQRRLALLWVALGGGLGWLLILLGQTQMFGSLPIDFYSPEAYTFLILYTLPHLAAARCLFLLGLLAYLSGKGGWAGLALLGVSLIQPLSVLVAWLVMGVDTVLGWVTRWRNAPYAIRDTRYAMPIAILLSSPVVAYTIFAFSTDPILKQWNAQNVLPSPHPLHYLFGYGIWLILGLWGGAVLQRRRPGLARFVVGWAVAIPFLLYAPIPTQRRLIEGFQLPVVALAVLGMTIALQRRRRWLVPAVFALTLPTSVILLLGGFRAASAPTEPIFLPADQRAVFDWLSKNAHPGQVALSAFETGNALPAYTPLIAYIGHGPETVFLAEKRPRVAAFYRSSTTDNERRQLLADGRIAFVLFGPPEHALGDFDPATAGYLYRQFSADEYAVYQVEP